VGVVPAHNLLLLLFIAVMQDIYNYIAETNRVARVQSVAALLYSRITVCATSNAISHVDCFVVLH
jgi:hypothetical protein